MNAGLKVSQLADKHHVSADTIRHYVRIGLLSPAKNDSGYHYFTLQDEKVLTFILSARDLGFSLDDIRLLLDDAEKGESPCPHARSLIEARLGQARQQLANLQALVKRMETATQAWQQLPDCEPCGEHICHLIEGVTHEH